VGKAAEEEEEEEEQQQQQQTKAGKGLASTKAGMDSANRSAERYSRSLPGPATLAQRWW
jgi:hypothetical protein